MTRFLAFSIAAFALAFSACERHPLVGQTKVTTVPGIDGVNAGHGDAHSKGTESHGKKDESAEKKDGAAGNH